MEKIDISDLDKSSVLAALYNASKPQGMGFIDYDSTPMTKEEAEKILRGQTDFDYLKGRVMKVNLSGDSFNPSGFDRDNGEGVAQEAISQLRETGDENSDLIQVRHEDGTSMSARLVRDELTVPSVIKQGVGEDTLTLVPVGLKEFADRLEHKVRDILGEDQ